MSAIAQLCLTLDEAYSHQDESILSALKSVTAEEAVWQHGSYVNEEALPDYPPSGSIFGKSRILHMPPVTTRKFCDSAP